MTDPKIDVAQSDSFEGYAVPPGLYSARRVRNPRYFATLGIWVLALLAGMMILALVDNRVTDVPTRYVCPPDCGRPPTGLPVEPILASLRRVEVLGVVPRAWCGYTVTPNQRRDCGLESGDAGPCDCSAGPHRA